MSSPEGYDFRTRPNGDVHLFQHGKMVKLLKGDDAKEFTAAVESGSEQEAMEKFAGAGGQHAKPGGGPMGGGRHLSGDGKAHTPQQFRRKSV